MPATKKARVFRPRIDGLEPIRLMSVAAPAATVHAQSLINLKASPVGTDALRTLSQSSPKFGRSALSLDILNVDPATRTISGKATGQYGIKLISMVKVRGTITFRTNLDDPKPGNVQFSLSQFNGFVPNSEKLKIQKAVVAFIQRDHDQIVAMMNAG